MLARAARGQGFRSVAAASGVPEDTVRDRLRRFRSSAGRVRELAAVVTAGSLLSPSVVFRLVRGDMWLPVLG